MNKISIALPILLSGLILFSCKNEDESKYDNIPVKSTSDTTFLKGQFAYYSFEQEISGVDSTGKLVSITYAGNLQFDNDGHSTSSKKSLHLNGQNFLQFSILEEDTVVYSFFVKSEDKLTSQKPLLIDFNGKSNLGLDGVTGPTYMTIDGISQHNCINSYDNWVFVYVEIIRKANKIIYRIKNTVDQTPVDAEYETTTNGTVSPGDLFRIGASFGGTVIGFNGKIDDLKIFNRALSDDEIKSISK
jgi:hypothetical protein